MKLQSQIPKVKKISCQRNCLNFINFLSIQLQRAENHNIKYNHKQTNNTVLNIIIMCQNHIGSHFMLECINQNIPAHITKAIINFFIFTFQPNKYRIGSNAHTKADIIIHRLLPELIIEK